MVVAVDAAQEPVCAPGLSEVAAAAGQAPLAPRTTVRLSFEHCVARRLLRRSPGDLPAEPDPDETQDGSEDVAH